TSGCSASGYSGSTSSVLGQVINGPHKSAPPVPTFRSGLAATAPSYPLGVNDVLTLPVNGNWSNTPFPQTGGLPSPPTNSPTCKDTTCDGTSAHPYEISSISMSGGGNGPNSPILKLVGSHNPAARSEEHTSELQSRFDLV